MKYVCNLTKPSMLNPVEIDADSPEEAAQNYFFSRDSSGIAYRRDDPDNGKSHPTPWFGRVAVAGHGEFIVRTFRHGLTRRGGVKRDNSITLLQIAEAIGWKGDPEELLTEGWDLEETWEQASKREVWVGYPHVSNGLRGNS